MCKEVENRNVLRATLETLKKQDAGHTGARNTFKLPFHRHLKHFAYISGQGLLYLHLLRYIYVNFACDCLSSRKRTKGNACLRGALSVFSCFRIKNTAVRVKDTF